MTGTGDGTTGRGDGVTGTGDGVTGTGDGTTGALLDLIVIGLPRDPSCLLIRNVYNVSG